MKIAIITSPFTPTMEHRNRIRNGLDSIVIKAIPLLLAAGHEVTVICVGPIDPAWTDNTGRLLIFSPHEIPPLETAPNMHIRRSLSKSYEKVCVNVLGKFEPDFVWSHVPNPTTSAVFAKHWPTTHHLHEVNQNAMFAPGRVRGMAKVIANGGSVYSSDLGHYQFRKFAMEYASRTDGDPEEFSDIKFVTHFQRVSAPLDDIILQGPIIKSNRRAFMIGRYDKKFTGKNIHRVDKFGIPMVAVVTGNNDKVFNQLLCSNTTVPYVNLASRELTVDLMRHAGCLIVGCTHESAPVSNIELMCCGALPVSLMQKDIGWNSATATALQLFDDVQKEVAIGYTYEAELLHERVNAELEAAEDIDRRFYIAETARKFFSHEAWMKELFSTIPGK